MGAISALPPDFLSNPNTDIKKHIIDFGKTELSEYAGYYACILDNVFSAERCANVIRAAKVQTDGEWHQATVNVGYGVQEVDTESRSCGRTIWDTIL